MSRILNPKAWYLVGIGAVALALDATRRWIKRRRQEAQMTTGDDAIIPMEPDLLAEQTPTPEPPAAKKSSPKPAPAAKDDDLTEIKGIGPTFARRLAEAGITTFAAVAAASPDHLREVTKATAIANPDEWVAQAREKG